MSKSPKRARRVSDLIHRNVAEFLQKEVNDPRLNKISITGVEVSADLSQAKVFYTLLDINDLKEVKVALKKATGYCRHLLAQTTTLRFVPLLQFIYDDSIERGNRISSLINKAVESDEKSDDVEENDES